MESVSIAGYSFHGALAEGTIDAFGYLEACRHRYGLATADLWCGALARRAAEAPAGAPGGNPLLDPRDERAGRAAAAGRA